MLRGGAGCKPSWRAAGVVGGAVPAVACPKAMAVVVPKLAARLQADGAKLEPSKSKWTTLGGKKTRRLGTAEMAIRAAARASVAAAQRAGCSTDMLRKYGKTAKGMRVDLGLEGPEGRRAMRLYEVKTASFCASRYRVRCPEGGLTWADKRGRELAAAVEFVRSSVQLEHAVMRA